MAKGYQQWVTQQGHTGEGQQSQEERCHSDLRHPKLPKHKCKEHREICPQCVLSASSESSLLRSKVSVIQLYGKRERDGVLPVSHRKESDLFVCLFLSIQFFKIYSGKQVRKHGAVYP